MSLSLVPSLCEVCDHDGEVEAFHGDVTAHPDCLPERWVTAREKHTEFMAKAMAKRTKEKR